MKQGEGSYYYANGNEYTGQWHMDRKHGYGIYKYKQTREKYEGNWKDGKKSGKGKFTFTQGDFYEGQFEQGHKNGFGRIKYKSGSEFKGKFMNNKA